MNVNLKSISRVGLFLLMIILPACTKKEPTTLRPAINHTDPLFQESNAVVLPSSKIDQFANEVPNIERIDNRHLNLQK